MSIEIDVRTDPLTWPLPPDAPATDDAWAAEYDAKVVRQQQIGEDDPTVARWPLAQLGDPPLSFKRRFLTCWHYAATVPADHDLDGRPIRNEAIFDAMDRLVAEERHRQVRNGLSHRRTSPEPDALGAGGGGAGRPPGGGPFPDFPAVYREALRRLTAENAPLTWESVASWIQEHRDPPRRSRNGTPLDLNASTVRGWAKAWGLPSPRG